MIKKGFKYFVIILTGSLLMGALYQQYGLSQDDTRYPMLGQRHSVGDRELHIHCVGEGSPTVVFEAGTGGHSGWWEPILKEVGKATQACAYDRAGMGWSPYVEGAITKQQVAEDLHRLLQAEGVQGDLVMVGHSQGGIYLRQFAKLFPNRVKGLVFIDSAHEQMGTRMKRAEERYQLEPFVPFDDLIGGMRSLNFLTQLGLTRFIAFISSDADSVGRRIGMMYAQPHSLKALATEIEMWRDSIYEERGPESLGDLPLTVIVRGVYEDGPTPQHNEAWRAFWTELQADLAGLSSRSELIVAEESDHIMMLFGQVDLCVSAIMKHVRIARELASPSTQLTPLPTAQPTEE